MRNIKLSRCCMSSMLPTCLLPTILAQAYFFGPSWLLRTRRWGCAASVSKCKVVPEMRLEHKTVEYDSEVSDAASFQLTKEEQIDFHDGNLPTYKSYDWREDDHPSGVPLPPGRKLHEQHLRRMNRFMRKVERLEQQSSLSEH